MTTQYLRVGMEGYWSKSGARDLKIPGEVWVPNFQFNVDSLTDGAQTIIPTDNPSAGSNYTVADVDNLINQLSKPLIVTKLSFSYRPSYASDYANFVMQLRLQLGGKAVTLPRDPVEAFPRNENVGRYGGLDNPLPYVWRPMARVVLKPGESIWIRCKNASASEIEHQLTLYGDRSGLPVVFSDYNKGAGETQSVYTNLEREDLVFDSIAMLCAEDVDYIPHFELRIGGQACMNTSKPFDLYAAPFPYARLLFNRLPAGGIVLEPGDSVSVTWRGVAQGAEN